jgi:hypothetical protein
MSSYGPLSALFYAADKPAAPAAEVAWYDARLPQREEPVLEVMSGSGRVLIPLLDADVSVHGCDASAAMLARCEANLDAIGFETTLLHQDVTTLDVPHRYAAAFIAAGSFQLLAEPAAARAALERIRAHLTGPSLLLLDLFIPAAIAHPPQGAIVEARSVTLGDGAKVSCRAESIVDVAARRIDTHARYERRVGPMILGRESETVSLTWYAEDEIAALLEAAGYREVEVLPAAWPVTAKAPAGERRYAVSARG